MKSRICKGLGMFVVAGVMLGGLAASLPAQAPSAYVVTLAPDGSSHFGSVNLVTGAFHGIANLPDSVITLVWWHGVLLTLGNGFTNAGELIQIDPATGAATSIGPTGLGGDAFSLGVVGDRLYLTDFNIGGGTQNLYSVNPATGAATLIGPTGIPADQVPPFSLNQDGTIEICDETVIGQGGRLYVTFDEANFDENNLAANENPADPSIAPAVYKVEPSTGATTVVAATDWYFDATARLGNIVYGLKGLVIGFAFGFPVPQTQISTLNLSNGEVVTGGMIDAAVGLVSGAVPVRN